MLIATVGQIRQLAAADPDALLGEWHGALDYASIHVGRKDPRDPSAERTVHLPYSAYRHVLGSLLVGLADAAEQAGCRVVKIDSVVLMDGTDRIRLEGGAGQTHGQEPEEPELVGHILLLAGYTPGGAWSIEVTHDITVTSATTDSGLETTVEPARYPGPAGNL